MILKNKNTQPSLQTCSKCHKDLPYSSFYKDKSKIRGLTSYCKNCSRKKAGIRYREKSDEIKEYQKKRWHNFSEEERDEIRDKNKKRSKKRRDENLDFFLIKESLYRKEHSEEIRKSQRKYRKNNLFQIRESAKEYNNSEQGKKRREEFYIKNPDYKSNYRKKYYSINKDEINRKSALYYSENASNVIKVNKAWRDANQKKVRVSKARYKALKKACLQELSLQEEKIMEDIYDYAANHNMQVDHIIPLSKKGKHHPGNLQVISSELNLRKNAKLGPFTDNSKGIFCVPYFSGIDTKLVKKYFSERVNQQTLSKQMGVEHSKKKMDGKEQ